MPLAEVMCMHGLLSSREACETNGVLFGCTVAPGESLCLGAGW